MWSKSGRRDLGRGAPAGTLNRSGPASWWQRTFPPNVGDGNGNLCIGGDLGRDFSSLQSTGASGTATHAVDWTSLPQSMGPVAATVGDVWNFQFWHRDTLLGVATSNLSAGLSVMIE